jgi:NitT/TauT family transport system ATP-binding protein
VNRIQAENLGHRFQAGKPVFSHINLEIQAGEFITFLGPSGCGKSTLLRLLGGLHKASEGKLKVQARAKSFVFQEPRLLPWRTCLENTFLPFQAQTNRPLRPEDKAKAQEILVSLGLGGDFQKFPHELSGGMKMRCALARGLVLNPDLLFFDEPFAALDEHTRLKLQAELRTLFEKNKWTVIFVTHSIEEATFLSDRIFLFPQSRQGLTECKLNLPPERSAKLRDDLKFFEEVSRVRQLFQKELQ